MTGTKKKSNFGKNGIVPPPVGISLSLGFSTLTYTAEEATSGEEVNHGSSIMCTWQEKLPEEASLRKMSLQSVCFLWRKAWVQLKAEIL